MSAAVSASIFRNLSLKQLFLRCDNRDRRHGQSKVNRMHELKVGAARETSLRPNALAVCALSSSSDRTETVADLASLELLYMCRSYSGFEISCFDNIQLYTVKITLTTLISHLV